MSGVKSLDDISISSGTGHRTAAPSDSQPVPRSTLKYAAQRKSMRFLRGTVSRRFLASSLLFAIAAQQSVDAAVGALCIAGPGAMPIPTLQKGVSRRRRPDVGIDDAFTAMVARQEWDRAEAGLMEFDMAALLQSDGEPDLQDESRDNLENHDKFIAGLNQAITEASDDVRAPGMHKVEINSFISAVDASESEMEGNEESPHQEQVFNGQQQWAAAPTKGKDSSVSHRESPQSSQDDWGPGFKIEETAVEGRGGAQRRWRTVDSWRSVDLKALGRSGTADKKSAEAREGPRDSKAEYPDAARLAGGIAGLMRRGSQVLDEMLDELDGVEPQAHDAADGLLPEESLSEHPHASQASGARVARAERERRADSSNGEVALVLRPIPQRQDRAPQGKAQAEKPAMCARAPLQIESDSTGRDRSLSAEDDSETLVSDGADEISGVVALGESPLAPGASPSVETLGSVEASGEQSEKWSGWLWPFGQKKGAMHQPKRVNTKALGAGGRQKYAKVQVARPEEQKRQDLAEAKLPLRPAGGGRGAARRLAFEDFAVC
jgi:hypothetical protein